MNKKLIFNLLSAVLSLVLAVTIILIVYSTMFSGSKSIFGFRIFVVTSQSMANTIDKGDMIITKSEKYLKAGDIITFISTDDVISGHINTHRIVKVSGENYYTKGDANQNVDISAVNQSNVLGKVIFHSSILGKLINNLSVPLNLFIFIFLPIAYIAISDILINRKKLKRKGKVGNK